MILELRHHTTVLVVFGALDALPIDCTSLGNSSKTMSEQISEQSEARHHVQFRFCGRDKV